MGLLDAFMSTWSQARQTFGQGAPADGAPFDRSAALAQLGVDVRSAEPSAHWSGGAAAAYAARNSEHADVLTELAGLDARLAAQVDRSAQFVTAGRNELDTVRDWVVKAASSVPNTPAGDAALMPIVSKGLADVSRVLVETNAELSTVGGTIHQIGGEYLALGNQRFAHGPVPQSPPDEELPWDETTWYTEWETLSQEARANNAALAAHLRTRPPNGSPPTVTGPWNAQLSVINANAHRIYREQVVKAAEAAEMGISVQTPTPPALVDDPDEVPLGVAPAGLFSAPAVDRPRPA